MPRRLLVSVLAAALLVLGALGAPVAPAQSQSEPVVMRLAAISPWTDPTRSLSASVQISNTSELLLENVSLRLTLHARVFNRSQLRLALDGRPQTGSLGSFGVPVEPIPPGEGRRIVLERARADFAQAASTGVYPVTITLSHSRGQQQLFTAVPHIASAPAAPINVAWILPVSRPTITPPDGVYGADAVDGIDLDGLVQRIDAMAAHPGVPLTLAINPSTLDTLADLSDGFATATPEGATQLDAASPHAVAAKRALETLRRATSAGAELASAPYAPADLPSLARHGPTGEIAQQMTVGRAILERHLGRAPNPAVMAPPGLVADTQTLGALSTSGVTGVVIDPALLVEQPTEPFQPRLFGPSRPAAFAGTSVRGLLPDLPLRARLDARQPGVLLAQAIIAETASAWLELPLFAPERVLVLAGNGLPSPPALGAMLAGLSGAPWVRMRHASDVLASLEPQGALLSLRRAIRPDTPYLAAARQARRALAVVQAIAIERFEGLDAVDRMILRAESSEWATDPNAGARLALSAQREAQAIPGSIEVAGRRVTLTSRTGSIPVTITYGGGGAPFLPVRVRVRVRSAKLDFPSGDAQNVDLTSRTLTLDFPVSARTAGTFPLDVLVETPDGTTVLTRGTLILRSSAVSAVTLAAVGGSTAFLLVAYVRRARRREGRARSRAAHPAGSARIPPA